jgi:uncharacterized membrane protein YidH (DUF202 family)
MSRGYTLEPNIISHYLLDMKKLVALGLFLSPLAAFATTAVGNVFSLINRLSEIINAIVPFIIGLAVLVIIWGLFNYIAGAGDEEKRGEAKQYIIWGVIGLFVMVSIWGLVGIVKNTFNISSATLNVPQVIPAGGCAPGTHRQITSTGGQSCVANETIGS